MDIENINSEEPKFIKKHISATLFVALVSAVGYLGAFSYEWSYLSYFGVPSFFVDVNLGTVLFVSLVALFWFSALGQLLFFIKKVKATTKTKKFFHYFGWFVFLVVYFLPFLLPLNLLLKCLALVGIVFLIFYLIKNKEKQKENVDFLDRLSDEYGSYIVILIAVLTLFIAYSSIVGFAFAKLGTSYLRSDQQENLIILSSYNGNLLGVLFNPETKIVDGHVTLLSQEQISKDRMTFTTKDIGQLSRSPYIPTSILRCIFSYCI